MRLSSKVRHHWPALILMVVSGVVAVGGTVAIVTAGPDVFHEMMMRDGGVQPMLEAALALGLTAATTVTCLVYLWGHISAHGLFGFVMGLLTYEYAVTLIWMVIAGERWSGQRMHEVLIDLIPAFLAWMELRIQRSRANQKGENPCGT